MKTNGFAVLGELARVIAPVSAKPDDESPGGRQRPCQGSQCRTAPCGRQKRNDVASTQNDVECPLWHLPFSEIPDLPRAIGEILPGMADEHRIDVHAHYCVPATGELSSDSAGATAGVEKPRFAWGHRVDEACLAVDVLALCDKMSPPLRVILRVIAVGSNYFGPGSHVPNLRAEHHRSQHRARQQLAAVRALNFKGLGRTAGMDCFRFGLDDARSAGGDEVGGVVDAHHRFSTSSAHARDGTNRLRNRAVHSPVHDPRHLQQFLRYGDFGAHAIGADVGKTQSDEPGKATIGRVEFGEFGGGEGTGLGGSKQRREIHNARS